VGACAPGARARGRRAGRLSGRCVARVRGSPGQLPRAGAGPGAALGVAAPQPGRGAAHDGAGVLVSRPGQCVAGGLCIALVGVLPRHLPRSSAVSPGARLAMAGCPKVGMWPLTRHPAVLFPGVMALGRLGQRSRPRFWAPLGVFLLTLVVSTPRSAPGHGVACPLHARGRPPPQRAQRCGPPPFRRPVVRAWRSQADRGPLHISTRDSNAGRIQYGYRDSKKIRSDYK
jgi:hypothetical protein